MTRLEREKATDIVQRKPEPLRTKEAQMTDTCEQIQMGTESPRG